MAPAVAATQMASAATAATSATAGGAPSPTEACIQMPASISSACGVDLFREVEHWLANPEAMLASIPFGSALAGSGPVAAGTTAPLPLSGEADLTALSASTSSSSSSPTSSGLAVDTPVLSGEPVDPAVAPPSMLAALTRPTVFQQDPTPIEIRPPSEAEVPTSATSSGEVATDPCSLAALAFMKPEENVPDAPDAAILNGADDGELFSSLEQLMDMNNESMAFQEEECFVASSPFDTGDGVQLGDTGDLIHQEAMNAANSPRSTAPSTVFSEASLCTPSMSPVPDPIDLHLPQYKRDASHAAGLGLSDATTTAGSLDQTQAGASLSSSSSFSSSSGASSLTPEMVTAGSQVSRTAPRHNKALVAPKSAVAGHFATAGEGRPKKRQRSGQAVVTACTVEMPTDDAVAMSTLPEVASEAGELRSETASNVTHQAGRSHMGSPKRSSSGLAGGGRKRARAGSSAGSTAPTGKSSGGSQSRRKAHAGGAHASGAAAKRSQAGGSGPSGRSGSSSSAGSTCTDDKNVPVRDKCMRCHTSAKNTPMMRKGPDGSRSMCNACGLRWARHGIF